MFNALMPILAQNATLVPISRMDFVWNALEIQPPRQLVNHVTLVNQPHVIPVFPTTSRSETPVKIVQALSQDVLHALLVIINYLATFVTMATTD